MPRTRHEDPTRSRPGDLAHRWLLAVLAALLLAIASWCVILLLRSVSLRQDIDVRRGWVDDMRRLRQELERPVGELEGRGHWPQLEGLRLASQQLLEGGPVAAEVELPPLRDAAQRLESSLEHLQRTLASREATGDASTERVWDASFAVLKAASALEERIQGQIDGIYQRLDGHWRSLNVLLVVCLLLCASNLGLLQLAHRRRGQLEVARDRALDLASHDGLTGLWNREAILKMLRRELARSKRLRAPLGVILADLDDFQEINGLIGQEQADAVLQEVGWRLGSLVRPYDTLGRFGGDSFLVILPTCDEIATKSVAERLRQAIHDQEIEYGLGRLEVRITLVSTTVERADDTAADLLIHRLQETLTSLRRGGESGGFAAVPED